MPPSLVTAAPTLASDTVAQVGAWRRHLHANPELSFNEAETSKFVEDTLKAIGGLEIHTPTGRPGPVLAMRADMDALPITEETQVPFASTRFGVVHACGHDGHTAMLLGAARELVARRDTLCGEVRFLFQHVEETFPGSADEMVSRGVMDGVTRVSGAQFHAGTTHNVIPETAEMVQVVTDVCGADAVTPMRPVMVREDFSAFQQKAPGTFFFVGAATRYCAPR